MRSLIVTAGDDTIFPFLDELIASLHLIDATDFAEIACFNVGLSDENLASVRSRVSLVVEPRWDFFVDENDRKLHPWLRAKTAKPFIPRYFPGYDLYVWIDADAWVQERDFLERLIEFGQEGAIVAALDTDANYYIENVYEWRASRLKDYFGTDISETDPCWDHYINSGVLALRADSPYWNVWADALELGLSATEGKLVTDQTALNHAIWTHGLRVKQVPRSYNWLCHQAIPYFDDEKLKFIDGYNNERVGIIHLAGYTKTDESKAYLRFGAKHKRQQSSTSVFRDRLAG